MCQSLVISRTELIMVLGEPARRFLGVGARVDGFAAEIDAAVEQLALPPSRRTRSFLVTDGSAPATSRRLALPCSSTSIAMFDPAASAGEDDDGFGRCGLAGAGLPSVTAKKMKPSA